MQHSRSLWLRLGQFSFLLLALLSCQKQVQTSVEATWQAPSEATLQAQYLAAVMDAAEPAAPDDIYRNLWNVSTDNSELRWKTIAGEAHLLISTWTSWDGYDSKVGQEMDLTRKIWISLAPQMQKFCSEYAGPLPLDLRLKQLLGLPPGDTKTKVIEMWVRPEDLFRPCADPGVLDYECQGSFTSSAYLTLSQDYVTWFDNQVSISYDPTSGYPWTRLGYTYDWNQETPKFGLSEYIVRENSIVWIHSTTETAAYCNKAP